MNRHAEWELMQAVQRRYYEEIKRIQHELVTQGVAIETEEGQLRFRSAILELNRAFMI
jgi:protein-disulfide isomerase-like protein with CxxC motif